jgi:biotin transporter BioY
MMAILSLIPVGALPFTVGLFSVMLVVMFIRHLLQERHAKKLDELLSQLPSGYQIAEAQLKARFEHWDHLLAEYIRMVKYGVVTMVVYMVISVALPVLSSLR